MCLYIYIYIQRERERSWICIVKITVYMYTVHIVWYCMFIFVTCENVHPASQVHCPHSGDPFCFGSQPRGACAPALVLTCYWSHRRCPVDVPTHHAHAELRRAQKAPKPQSWVQLQAAFYGNGFYPDASGESPTFFQNFHLRIQTRNRSKGIGCCRFAKKTRVIFKRFQKYHAAHKWSSPFVEPQCVVDFLLAEYQKKQPAVNHPQVVNAFVANDGPGGSWRTASCSAKGPLVQYKLDWSRLIPENFNV